jgi:hypothetical protein
MKYLLASYIVLLFFLTACDSENPAAWRKVSDDNFLIADISGGINVPYIAQELRYSKYTQIDTTVILNIQSKSSQNNYLYNFSMEIPLKPGKFFDTYYINTWISLGNRKFQFGYGYIKVEKVTVSFVRGNFEFSAYQYEYENSVVTIVDSIIVKNGKFQILL